MDSGENETSIRNISSQLSLISLGPTDSPISKKIDQEDSTKSLDRAEETPSNIAPVENGTSKLNPQSSDASLNASISSELSRDTECSELKIFSPKKGNDPTATPPPSRGEFRCGMNVIKAGQVKKSRPPNSGPNTKEDGVPRNLMDFKRLIVGNLRRDISESELTSFFHIYGAIEGIELLPASSERSSRTANLTFSAGMDAEKAVLMLYNNVHNGLREDTKKPLTFHYSPSDDQKTGLTSDIARERIHKEDECYKWRSAEGCIETTCKYKHYKTCKAIDVYSWQVKKKMSILINCKTGQKQASFVSGSNSANSTANGIRNLNPSIIIRKSVP